jgi:hypothetical protein
MIMQKMISKIKYGYKKTGTNYEIDLMIDLMRFEKQYTRAQWQLDNMVMTSMVKYMPHQTGTFIKVTRAMSQAIAGSGKVVAAAPPFGRYLYNGEVMVDELTGSPWARKGARKVLVSQYSGKTGAKTELDLSRGKNPDAQKEWFEAAKKAYGDRWEEQVKQLAGGGGRG